MLKYFKLGGGKLRIFTRDENLDIAKGLGILLVVWGHCSQFLFGEIYAFHMPLFFFLSGCVLSVDKPYKEIIKKKVKQLLLPYVFFILLSCCFYWMLLLLSHRFTINHLWSLVDLFPYDNEIINTPLWFLVSLFWMSIIYSGIRKCVSREWIVGTVVVVFYFIVELAEKYEVSLPFFLGRGIGEMIYMHLGFFFYKRGYVFQLYRLKKSCQVYLFLLSAIAFVCLFYCAEKIYVDKEMLFRIIHLFTAISGIFFILMGAILCAVLSGVFKVLCYLGRNTLYIFAVHLPLLEFARPIGKYVIGSNGLGYDSIVFLTDLVLAIIVSWGLKIGKDSFSKKLPHYSPTGIIE